MAAQRTSGARQSPPAEHAQAVRFGAGRGAARPRTPNGLVMLGVCAAIAVLAAYVLRDTPGYVVFRSGLVVDSDIRHYVLWTRLVTLTGLTDAYHGTWPETYAVYGPVVLVPYQVIGSVYRALIDPEFALPQAIGSQWLHHRIKGVAVAWHLCTGAALYALLRGRGERTAGAAGALYLVNPAVLFNGAHWAQPDGAHALFGVLAAGLARMRPALGGAAMALALLAKPQALAVLPVVALASLHTARTATGQRAGWWRTGAWIGGAVLTTACVSLPFVLAGRLGDLISLPATIPSVMPVLSANAHNVWWIAAELNLTRGGALSPDAAPLLGPLSYRSAALVAVGVAFLFACWLYVSRRAAVAEAAALAVAGWFVFTTQAHENHLIFALALLALAWPERPRLLGVFGVLSVTILLNMALHDRVLLHALGLAAAGGEQSPSIIIRAALRGVRLANAGTVVGCYALWATSAARRAPGPSAAT